LILHYIKNDRKIFQAKKEGGVPEKLILPIYKNRINLKTFTSWGIAPQA